MSEKNRFAFGKNWAQFLEHITEEQITRAQLSLTETIGKDVFPGKQFLDIGCGSGLFSLAARRLGATVTSFDYDGDSIRCTQSLKERFYPHDNQWAIMQGSALDSTFMDKLGLFDIVYAWGVLHHTGNQWKAVDHAMSATGPNGILLMALYNDQGWVSRYWTGVKWLYMHARIIRPLLMAFYAPYFVGVRWLVRRFKKQRFHERGMSLWYDMIDWIGGWPFEVAAPQKVVARVAQQGFKVMRVKTVGRRQGCNEFVFVRIQPEGRSH